MRLEIRVQATPLDTTAEIPRVYGGDPSVGGVVCFIGLMRDFNQGERVAAMTLEHYPGMTERALNEIAAEAASRWSLNAVTVVHRVGEILPEEPIVLVAVASAHRGDAFHACEFLIDYLKTRAPFWKKERLADGRSRWVSARASDEQAAGRWEPGALGAD